MRPKACRMRWMAISLCAVLWAGACTLDIVTPDEPPPDRWDPALNTHPDGDAFQKLLDGYVREGLPGAVLLVRTPEGLWNGSAGYARLETSDPMTPAHRHYAASMTKMYTAAAVMLLVEDQSIDLDAKISRYLPPSVYGRVPNASASTVRQVLGHTSGIPDFGVLAYDLDTINEPMGSYPPERMLSYVEDEVPLFSPGNGYMYSNTNYLLLALMIDHVTGASHADMITERLLEPLGLAATYYKNESGYPSPPGLVNSYQDLAGDGRLMNVSDLVVHSTGEFMGYTGIIATSADYASFLEALLAGDLVGPDLLGDMLERTECDCYGLGLSFIETKYGDGIGHSGGDLGVMSEARYFPDADATIVLLINGGDNGITEKLFKLLWDDVASRALDGLP